MIHFELVQRIVSNNQIGPFSRVHPNTHPNRDLVRKAFASVLRNSTDATPVFRRGGHQKFRINPTNGNVMDRTPAAIRPYENGFLSVLNPQMSPAIIEIGQIPQPRFRR